MGEIKRICGFCDRYDSRKTYCPIRGEMFEEDTCDNWCNEDYFTAQVIDTAERETHRKEVEGDIE